MTRTANFAFNITDFNKIPWTDNEHENWYLVDAIFARFIAISNIKGTWKNATIVSVGERYVDTTSGAIYTVAEAHTTSSTGTFEDDRTTYTSYWTLFSEVELAESWATSLVGLVNDTDYSSKAYAIGTLAQLPTGSAKRWAAEVEDTPVISGYYSALHYAAKAAASASAASSSATTASTAASTATTQASNASTSASNAATSETNAATSESNAATSETNAATSETNAQSYATQAQAAAYGWVSITNITASSTDLETTDTRKYYKIDASSNTVTINLPAIGTDEGMVYRFEVVNADNTITIVRDGTDYINSVDGNYTLSVVGTIIDFVSDDATPDNWLASFATNITVDDVTLAQTGTTFKIKDSGVDTTQLADASVTTAKVDDDAITAAKALAQDNNQTGTTYTLVLTDKLKTVWMNNASANTLTIPTNASVAFAIGTRIDVIMEGAGATTVTADTGVTLNGTSAGSATISAQYSGVSLYKRGTDAWVILGNHGGVA